MSGRETESCALTLERYKYVDSSATTLAQLSYGLHGAPGQVGESVADTISARFQLVVQ